LYFNNLINLYRDTALTYIPIRRRDATRNLLADNVFVQFRKTLFKYVIDNVFLFKQSIWRAGQCCRGSQSVRQYRAAGANSTNPTARPEAAPHHLKGS
jgi:hypothetical protein